MGKHKPRHQRRDLLQTIYANQTNLAGSVREFIAAGVDLDHITEYSESPLRVASNNGRFDVVKLLIDAGADHDQLGWSPSFFPVAFGKLKDIRASLAKHQDIEARDFWQRTPLLLAIQTGIVDKAELLLELGADPLVVGRCGKVPVEYAVQGNHRAMLEWLDDQGFDIEAEDDFGRTALITAAELGLAESVQWLISAGANIVHGYNTGQRAIEVATTRDVVDLLVAAGDDINAIDEEMHATLLGIGYQQPPDTSREAYLAGRHRRFGHGNPERVEVPFWDAMIRSGASAWSARERFDTPPGMEGGPVWCYSRFGRSTNILDDGRIIEIGGEHEDSYDPDFCIYNDVTVFHPGGRIETYTYPEDIFPPTDFHSATVVAGLIVIIGRLGYRGTRIPDITPVHTLDLKSLRIDRVQTHGDYPGWISAHQARLDGGSAILVEGGQLENKSGSLCENTGRYRLSVDTWVWERVD